MKSKILSGFAPIAIGLMLVGASALTASAQTLGASVTAVVNASGSAGGVTVTTNSNVNLNARYKNIVTRANEEITRRINALNALSARINAMAKVSSSDKASLSSSIQAQIQNLTTLQGQISTDASADATSSLKTDVQSITGSYRIFALILPQGAIEAASDRGLTIVSMFQTVGTELQARISSAQASGTNVSAAQTAYADFSAKISDANTNLQAAVSEVANLTPDNGNQTQLASNTAALKDARSKVKVANQDFVSARADVKTISNDLGIKAMASGSVNVTSTAQ